MKPNHIVFTTIHEPNLLMDFRDNIARHGHLEDTICWVVGDHKTPSSCQALCEKASNAGLETRYLDIPQQDTWGSEFTDIYSRIPYNNETRRNIGFLNALEDGCERLISIDDDNFPTEDDFIGFHAQTGCTYSGEVLSSSSSFHNICDTLVFNTEQRIFPRGYPFNLRQRTSDSRSFSASSGAVIGTTSGLWLRDPDVDATTWINQSPQAAGYTGPDRFVLDNNTWSPINTQNTSVSRELIPAFLCIPMGTPVPGGRIERYGDIWGGYFLQAAIQNTTYLTAYGRPLVEHRRNPHNYLDDLRHEFWGMILTDWLLTCLKEEFKPGARKLSDRVLELADFLEEISSTRLPDWCPEEVQRFLQDTAATQRAWIRACNQIGL